MKICNQLQLITITNYDYPMSGLWDTILKGTHPGTIYARFAPYIDASCQVWLHLAKLFQRRNFFLTLANQKKELILAAMFVGRMEPNEEAL